LVEEGESTVAEKIADVFDTYQEALLVVVRALSDDPRGALVTNEGIDSAYARLFEAEKKLYEDVTEYILSDLVSRWRHSLAKSKEAYQRTRQVERAAFDLKNRTFRDVSELSKQYNGLLEECDEIDGLIIASVARSRSLRIWQLIAGVSIAVLSAFATKILRLW